MTHAAPYRCSCAAWGSQTAGGLEFPRFGGLGCPQPGELQISSERVAVRLARYRANRRRRTHEQVSATIRSAHESVPGAARRSSPMRVNGVPPAPVLGGPWREAVCGCRSPSVSLSRERDSGAQLPRGRLPRIARESPSKPSTRFARADQGATRADLPRSTLNRASTEQTPSNRPRTWAEGAAALPRHIPALARSACRGRVDGTLRPTLTPA